MKHVQFTAESMARNGMEQNGIETKADSNQIFIFRGRLLKIFDNSHGNTSQGISMKP